MCKVDEHQQSTDLALEAPSLKHRRRRRRRREKERERALLGTIHNGGSRAAPAHGLCITTLRSASPYTLDGVAAYMAKTSPDSDERLAEWYQ